MIDLTLNKKDKDNFITHVYMQEDEPFYYVRYASGREEKFPFSLHNMNVCFLQMERQFQEFRDGYVEKVYYERLKANINKLVQVLIAIGGVYLTTALPFTNIAKILIDLVIAVYTIYYQKCQSAKVAICNTSDEVVMTAQEFINNRDKFTIKTKDPRTGEEGDWYLLSLSTIEDVDSVKELKMIEKAMTPEVLEEQAELTDVMLKKLVLKGDLEQC